MSEILIFVGRGLRVLEKKIYDKWISPVLAPSEGRISPKKVLAELPLNLCVAGSVGPVSQSCWWWLWAEFLCILV